MTVLSPAGFWTPRNGGTRSPCCGPCGGSRSALPLPLIERMSRTVAGRTALTSTIYTRPGRRSPEAVVAETLALRNASGFARTLAAGQDVPFTDDVPGVPVTVAWGSKDRLLPRRQGVRAKAAIPGARLVRLPGCGHVPMNDDPALVTRVILDGSRPVGAPPGGGGPRRLSRVRARRRAPAPPRPGLGPTRRDSGAAQRGAGLGAGPGLERGRAWSGAGLGAGLYRYAVPGPARGQPAPDVPPDHTADTQPARGCSRPRCQGRGMQPAPVAPPNHTADAPPDAPPDVPRCATGRPGRIRTRPGRRTARPLAARPLAGHAPPSPLECPAEHDPPPDAVSPGHTR